MYYALRIWFNTNEVHNTGFDPREDLESLITLADNANEGEVLYPQYGHNCRVFIVTEEEYKSYWRQFIKDYYE